MTSNCNKILGILSLTWPGIRLNYNNREGFSVKIITPTGTWIRYKKKDPDPRTIQPDASQITELCLPEARATGRYLVSLSRRGGRRKLSRQQPCTTTGAEILHPEQAS
jgi:hypothetical protein